MRPRAAPRLYPDQFFWSPSGWCGTARIAIALATLLAVPVTNAEDAAVHLERIRADLGELRQALANDAGKLSVAREESFGLEREIAAVEAHQVALEQRIAGKRTRITDLRHTRQRLDEELSQSRQLLERNAVARYTAAHQPRLKLLLSQDQARDMSRNMTYYDYVLHAYRRDSATLAAQLKASAETTAALKLETTSLRRLRHENSTEIERLSVLRDEHRALIDAIEMRMAQGNNRLTQLHEDEARLLQLVGELATQGSDAKKTQNPFKSYKGQLAWPVQGRIANAPGRALRSGGAVWAGVLITSPAGADVKAIAAGEVVFADWFRNLGKLVIIDHGDGYMSLYGNNAEVIKKSGDSVAAGDTIATLGAGSGEMPTGAYFELRERGQPLDPRSWCARR